MFRVLGFVSRKLDMSVEICQVFIWLYAVRPIKVCAPAADTCVVALAHALDQDEHELRDMVVTWLKSNTNARLTLFLGDKILEASLKDVWNSEYGGAGLDVTYLGRGGKPVVTKVTAYGNWAHLMRKAGTETDLLFRCAVAAMFSVTLVCGDLEVDEDSEEPNILGPVDAKRKIHLWWSINEQGWYWGDETKECASEVEMRYVKNLRYERVLLQGDNVKESVHVHKVEREFSDEGFFSALAGALNYDAGFSNSGTALRSRTHTSASVSTALRKHCESNIDTIGTFFKRFYIDAGRCMWKVGSQREVGFVPENPQQWLEWVCSGEYEVDLGFFCLAAECFQVQVIVVKKGCECTRAVVCCRVCLTIPQCQIK